MTASDGLEAPRTATPSRRRWSRSARPGVVLVVTAISLYALLPSLTAVFGSWRSLSHLTWYWVALALLSEIGSFVCLWQLDRIALHVKNWLTVSCAQLAGNAVGRILPGGAATASAFSIGMLRRAGVNVGDAAASLAATTSLQLGSALALPLLACLQSWAARPSIAAWPPPRTWARLSLSCSWRRACSRSLSIGRLPRSHRRSSGC